MAATAPIDGNIKHQLEDAVSIKACLLDPYSAGDRERLAFELSLEDWRGKVRLEA